MLFFIKKKTKTSETPCLVGTKSNLSYPDEWGGLGGGISTPRPIPLGEVCGDREDPAGPQVGPPFNPSPPGGPQAPWGGPADSEVSSLNGFQPLPQ